MLNLIKGGFCYIGGALVLLGLISFGGLLFPKHDAPKVEETVEVQVEEEEEVKKKPEVKLVKEDEVVESKDMPQFERVQVEEQQAGPQNLAQNSLEDIASMLDGGGADGGGGGGAGGFGNLSGTLGSNIFGNGGESGGDADFGADALDQPPRALSQPQPKLPQEVKRQPGVIDATLYVDERGQVFKVMFSGETNPTVVEVAREAFLKWRFEPGQRDGKPAGFRLKQKLRWGGRSA